MRFERVLITGASGFVGGHLARLLLERGCGVYGLQRGAGATLPAGVVPLRADLSEPASLAVVPREWDAVVHLAGAAVPSLFDGPAPVLANVACTLNLLDHVRRGRVLLVSSCYVYAPAVTPRREEDPLLPQGRYGLSKYLVEQLAPHYRQRLDVRLARPFNLLGPGQRPELVVPSLLRRLVAGHAGDQSRLLMRGIDSTRDFTDVRDVAEAYLAMLGQEAPPQTAWNACSGRGVSIAEVASEAMRLLGRSRELVFEGRPNSSDDNPWLVGDPSRLAATGWRPRFTLRESLAEMLRSLGS